MISSDGDPLASGPQGRACELAPGQALRFTAAPSAYLSPAEYRAVLLLDHGDPGNGCDLVHGVLAIELPPLRVVHR